MFEGKPPGVQGNASVAQGCWSAILHIAGDRASHGAQLNANLVRTARYGTHLQEESPAPGCQNAVAELSLECPLRFAAVGCSLVALLVLGQPVD